RPPPTQMLPATVKGAVPSVFDQANSGVAELSLSQPRCPLSMTPVKALFPFVFNVESLVSVLPSVVEAVLKASSKRTVEIEPRVLAPSSNVVGGRAKP